MRSRALVEILSFHREKDTSSIVRKKKKEENNIGEFVAFIAEK